MFSVFLAYLLYIYFQSNIFKHFLFITIQYNGCFAIKLTQWIQSRQINFDLPDDLFKQIYKQNYNHSLEYTKQLYFKEFQKPFDDVYSIENTELVASGSIGQVYEAIEKETNTRVAIKVKHPNLLFNFHYNWFILSSILKLIHFFNFEIILDVLNFTDIEAFKKDFLLQLNFYNEASNQNKFYQLYENNNLIIIPKLLHNSDSFLISEFIPSTSIHNSSVYTATQITSLLQMFQCNNACIVEFLHNDLHIGNWGITKTKDFPFQLVVYDFGFCKTSNVPKPKMQLLCYLYVTHQEKELNEYMIDNYIVDDISLELKRILINKCIVSAPIDALNILHELKQNCKQYHLQINPIIVDYLLCYNLTEKVIIQYNNLEWKKTSGIYTFQQVINNNLNFLSICQTYDCFHELQEYYKSVITKCRNNVQKTSNLNCSTDLVQQFYEM